MYFSMGVAELRCFTAVCAAHVLYSTFHFPKFYSVQCSALSESRMNL